MQRVHRVLVLLVGLVAQVNRGRLDRKVPRVYKELLALQVPPEEN